ncbi:unnamed protein product [Thlaspi arvense]|uniref:F-box associated beta-propeller type 1 domain-containing protein n=1 Tax=Thlaspi arvense TaxID=13288 RepID=A0AAU9SE11_THLAR|nr:unnamed protein product [Thlaspi arvense]
MLNRFRLIQTSKSYNRFDIYGFGYDSVSRDNYKILRINQGQLSTEIEIYEFKSKLWRSVDATLECYAHALRGSVSMNGNMYWIARKKMVNSETENEIFIQNFDFSTETFKPICCVPKGIEYSLSNGKIVLLSDFGGDMLSLLHHHKNVKIEVWVTSKLADGVVSWSKYFNVTYDPFVLHSTSRRRIGPTCFIHKTNKIMLLCPEYDAQENNVYIDVYEMCKDEIKKQVEMTGRHIFFYTPCSVYVPSLVPVTFMGALAVESKLEQ